jgi:hypothetical protein
MRSVKVPINEPDQFRSSEQAVKTLGDFVPIKWERAPLIGAVVTITMLYCRPRSSSLINASIWYKSSTSCEDIGSLKDILRKSSPLILTKFGLS